MAKKIKLTESELTEARNQLRKLFPAGSVVTMTAHSFSSAGYGARSFSVLAIAESNGGKPYIRNVSRLVAPVLGMPYDRDSNSVRSFGCGMDMAFHLAYSLGRTLYGESNESELTGAQKSARTRVFKSRIWHDTTDAGYLLDYRAT